MIQTHLTLNFRKEPRGELNKTDYRSGTVNSESFVGKVLLRIKWKFELINAL